MLLGVLLPGAVLVLSDRSFVGQDGLLEVDVLPAKAALFPSACSGHHRQPNQRSPVKVLPGFGDDARRVSSAGRRGVWLFRGRWLGLRDGANGYPSPADRFLVGAAQDEVDLSDAGRAERFALVGSASAVAGVWALGPVIDLPSGFAGAVDAASAQLRVEGVEHVRVEGADLDVPDERLHMVTDVVSVSLQRGALSGPLIGVAAKQLRDGGRRARVPALVDLIEKSGPSLLRRPSVRAGRNGLPKVVRLLGHWVDPCVHPHPQRPAGQLFDTALLARSTLRSGGHSGSMPAFRATSHATRGRATRDLLLFSLVKCGAPGRIRTCDARFLSQYL